MVSGLASLLDKETKTDACRDPAFTAKACLSTRTSQLSGYSSFELRQNRRLYRREIQAPVCSLENALQF